MELYKEYLKGGVGWKDLLPKYEQNRDSVEFPESLKAHNAVHDLLVANQPFKFLDWVDTDEGQKYLEELRSNLEDSIRVYRGLRNVLVDHYSGDVKENRLLLQKKLRESEEFGPLVNLDVFLVDELEFDGTESFTRNEEVAKLFALGRKKKGVQNKTLGVVCEHFVDKSTVLFDQAVVDRSTLPSMTVDIEKEAEVTVLWDDSQNSVRSAENVFKEGGRAVFEEFLDEIGAGE